MILRNALVSHFWPFRHFTNNQSPNPHDFSLIQITKGYKLQRQAILIFTGHTIFKILHFKAWFFKSSSCTAKKQKHPPSEVYQCMYVKRIRKIKNYKERVIILKIVKDMDMCLSPPRWGTPPKVFADYPRWLMRHPNPRSKETLILFFVFSLLLFFSTLTPLLANVKV